MKDLDEEARIIQEITRKDNGTDPFSAAVRATRMPMLITDPRQPDNPIVFANNAFSKLTGFSRQDIIGRNCRFLQGPETSQGDVSKLRDAIAQRVPIEIELLNYRKDGETFWNRLLVSPVFDAEGALSYFFASQFDVTLERERLVRLERDRKNLETEVNRRDAELYVTEQRLRYALTAARMGSWTLDLATERMVASDGCKENFGRPLSEPFTYEDLKAAVHPADRVKRDAAIAEAIANDTPLDIEYRLRSPMGEERWVQIRGQAAYRADGTPLSMSGVSQDITDRKRAEEHRTLLSNELNHRVKNSLAMVQAVVTQTMRRSSTLEEAKTTIEARIQAMAVAIDLLVSDNWEGASIRGLLGRTLAPFKDRDATQFDLAGPDVPLSPRVAAAFALGIHELATNASKYGSLSTVGGTVKVQWELADISTGRELRFRWEEHGGPPVQEPERRGFGSLLIERVLAHEVGGAAKTEYRKDGVVFSAVAPLDDEDADNL